MSGERLFVPVRDSKGDSATLTSPASKVHETIEAFNTSNRLLISSSQRVSPLGNVVRNERKYALRHDDNYPELLMIGIGLEH